MSEKPTTAIKPNDPARYQTAVNTGLDIISKGQSKADAARAIFELLQDEQKEVVIKAFIEGATVTEKGSPTYFYNIKRQYKKKIKKTN